jgi:hypothetical protein
MVWTWLVLAKKYRDAVELETEMFGTHNILYSISHDVTRDNDAILAKPADD